MAELRPQFWYDPDRNLEFYFTKEEEELAPPELVGMAITELDATPGVEVTSDKDITHVLMRAGEALDPLFQAQDDEPMAELLQRLNILAPYHPIDDIDRVVGMEWPSPVGLDAGVYSQLQRWINAFSPEENRDFSRQVINSLKEPFPDSPQSETHYAPNGVSSSGYRFFLSKDEGSYARIELYSIKETDTETIERTGAVRWRSLTLETMGNCACLGFDQSLGQIYIPEQDGQRLYELKPHNIDYARQTFSLILGLGTVAFEAANFKSDEDVMADVRWDKPRVIPK